ncbi:alpha/beta fold hydrolase [Streptomyces sp. 7N604]|uniref:alpha/beta fold hydrolase n=1 Tax=Streptomyces sp. 7N604 TaxID=3457415 RepID=UPI003FCF5579
MTGADRMWTAVGTSHLYGEELALYSSRFSGPAATHSQEGLPAMAFIHGLEDGWANWTPLARLLADRFRCHSVELPWRTGSTYRWRARATAAQWVEAGLGLVPEPVSVLVAHSLGANSVLQWLATGVQPRYDAIVLLSPFYRSPSLTVNWGLMGGFREDFESVMKAGLRARLGARAETMDPGLFDGMAQKALDRIGPQGFLALLDQYVSASDLPLSHVTVPTLVIAGDQDPGIAGDRAEALIADMPGAELHLDPRLAHFCQVAQPDIVADLICAFART